MDHSACIIASAFDTDALGVPFYRVHRIDRDSVARELASLPTGAMVDAKVPAENTRDAAILTELGFRRVSVQFTLRHDFLSIPDPPETLEIRGTVQLDEQVLWKHARNFRVDRFSLDAALSSDRVANLYYRWIRNSLTLGNKLIALHPPSGSFCTFALKADRTAAIDLTSVLDPGRGLGFALVLAVMREARRLGATTMFVTTECENPRAWNLYLRCGFVPDRFTSAFHWTRPLSPSHR